MIAVPQHQSDVDVVKKIQSTSGCKMVTSTVLSFKCINIFDQTVQYPLLSEDKRLTKKKRFAIYAR